MSRNKPPASAFLLGALIVLLAGCATNQPTLTPNGRDIISAEDLAELPFVTAYDAVHALRPWWLNRSGGRPQGPAIYRDEERVPGGSFVLGRMLIETVQEIRHYDHDLAVAKWGPELENRSGAIQVVSQPARDTTATTALDGAATDTSGHR